MMFLYKHGLLVARRFSKTGADYLFFMAAIALLMGFSLFTFFSLWLDRFFFPGFRKIRVDRPVFIIGHPRSGTTFIHHLFTQTGEMAAFKAWHILFPALSARALLKPIIDYFIRRNRTILLPAETGHQIALDQVEEEEMLFLHLHDTQFVTIGTPLGLLEDDFRDLRFHDLQPRSRRIKSASFLKACFQRQIFYTGKQQIFAQTHFSTHRIKTLREVFPEAFFIYIHRMPAETLPSYFSLNYKTLDSIWGLHRFPRERILRSFQKRYDASRELYQYFYDLWHHDEIDKERTLIIPYRALQDDLLNTFETIIAFTGIEPSLRLRKAVEKQAAAQSRYRRRHTVQTLAEFGIDSHRLEKDFAFLTGDDPYR